MLDRPPGPYRVFADRDVVDHLAGLPQVRDLIGGAASDWRVRDVADGNLNAVFLVDGPQGGVCVKQALPFVRVAGESWPLDVKRADYEAAYAARLAPHVKGLAPEIHHYDPELFVIVMEKLEPHVILRRGLIAGDRFPKAPEHVAEYVAQAAFHTSDLAAPFEKKAADVALFAQNLALQRITVDLVFTDPYVEVWRNKVTAPLAAWAASLRADAARAIAQCEDTAFIRSAGTEWTPKGLYYQADPGNIFPSTITKAQIAASVAAGNVAVLAAVQNDFQVLFSAIANACVPMENMGIIMSKRTEYFFKFGVRDGLGRLVLGEEMEKGTLFGVKYKSTTVIPNNLGAGGIDSEIYLADFDQVVIADAPVVSVQYSQEASVVDPDGVTHNLFQDDLTGIRFIEEHDMGVFYPKAIAVLTGVEYGA